MIGTKDPFVQIMRTTNFSSRVEDYADKVRVSYDKMVLPKIGSRLEELTNTVESQIKVNSTIKSIYENLSNKLKQLCDLLDSKYSSRGFNEENSPAPPSVAPAVEAKEESAPTNTDV